MPVAVSRAFSQAALSWRMSVDLLGASGASDADFPVGFQSASMATLIPKCVAWWSAMGI